ncbi:pyridoxal phosphate-dependent aminotransferase [Aerococcaceae bacterium WGS1372]
MDYNNINKHLLKTPENLIRSFNDQISSIKDLLYFNIGEPDFPTPNNIKQAAIQSIQDDQSFYAHSRGVYELREAVSRFLKRKYQLDYSPDKQIFITAGATQALYIAINGVLNEGEEVLVIDPNYVIYNSQIIAAGGSVVPINVSDTEFKLTAESLRAHISPKTKALILNHPTNPTGATYSAEELKDIADVIRESQIYVISDEVYSEFSYSHPHTSIANFIPDLTLLVNGSSKSHAMTGWRSAFLAGPSDLMDSLYPLHQAILTTITTQVQYASIEAYEQSDDSIKMMYHSYKDRRDLLIEGLNKLTYDYVYPEGAFYLFCKVPNWYEDDDYQFCLDLAHQVQVALTPGQIFGDAGRGYFRISYVSSLDNLKELLNRLASFEESYKAK